MMYECDGCEKICKLAYFDSLTNLYNRNMLELLRTEYDSKDVYVTLVDVDNLKLMNDKYGHEKGDSILIEVAKSLSGIVSKSGKAFRLGGDEFLLLTPTEVDNVIPHSSFGCFHKPVGMSLSRAISNADNMMYTSKKLKKLNCVRYPNHIAKLIASEMLNKNIPFEKRVFTVQSMPPNEVFGLVLQWEGIIGYDYKIKSWIKDIYGVDLEGVE